MPEERIFRIRHAPIFGVSLLVSTECLLEQCFGWLDNSNVSENWKRRTQLVEYCTSVLDQSLKEKREALQEQSDDPSQRRKTQAAMFADEVKVRSGVRPLIERNQFNFVLSGKSGS